MRAESISIGAHQTLAECVEDFTHITLESDKIFCVENIIGRVCKLYGWIEHKFRGFDTQTYP
jgi:hypothetical protein